MKINVHTYRLKIQELIAISLRCTNKHYSITVHGSNEFRYISWTTECLQIIWQTAPKAFAGRCCTGLV